MTGHCRVDGGTGDYDVQVPCYSSYFDVYRVVDSTVGRSVSSMLR